MGTVELKSELKISEGPNRDAWMAVIQSLRLSNSKKIRNANCHMETSLITSNCKIFLMVHIKNSNGYIGQMVR